MAGVWSATPTPFTESMEIDEAAVERMVAHHLRLGVKGLFVGGTCGEGPWMTDAQRRALLRAIARSAKGRLFIAAQVTDNSAARILDNMRVAAEEGADIAVIAPPYFLLNATPQTVQALYQRAIRESPLPVGIYDRGTHSSIVVSDDALKEVYAEEKVVLVKDSTGEPGRREIALAAREKRPELCLLNGNEFNCVEYLQAGYDGLLLGGGIFNGYLAGQIMAAVAAGDIDLANRLQQHMNQMMYAVYGGEQIECWLSGQKKLLVEMGIFSTWRSYLDYPLTASCERAIREVIERERDVLFP